jgi:hypothetical protein
MEKWLHEARSCTPMRYYWIPEGILILKAQAQLLKILRDMADALLEGLGGDEPFGGLSLNRRLDSRQVNAVDSGAYCVNEIFASLPDFDLITLSSIVQTRLAMVSDHSQQLQTDPAYMRRYVNLMFEGQPSKGPETEAYAAVAMDIDFDIWTARHWSWIVQEIKDLNNIRSRYLDSIRPGEPLPHIYNKRLGSVEALLY